MSEPKELRRSNFRMEDSGLRDCVRDCAVTDALGDPSRHQDAKDAKRGAA
jgi:hypothetical protein